MAPVENLSAAVLAGGASSRMGRNKALLELAGVPLIERVLSRLAQLSDDRIIVANDPASYTALGARVVPDRVGPGQGPLAGIASALHAARHQRVLVVATDMPFLHVPLLRFLARLAPADVVVPVISPDGFPETLHAIYHRNALPVIEAYLATGRRKITGFFPDVTVRYVSRDEVARFDPHFHSFFNANTSEEWARAETLAEEETGMGEN